MRQPVAAVATNLRQGPRLTLKKSLLSASGSGNLTRDPPTRSSGGDDFRWRLPLDLIWHAVTIWQVETIWQVKSRFKTPWQAIWESFFLIWQSGSHLTNSDHLKSLEKYRPGPHPTSLDDWLMPSAIQEKWFDKTRQNTEFQLKIA